MIFMIRRAFPLALVAAWMLLTHAPALAAAAAPAAGPCCCTDSCPAAPTPLPARSACGCAAVCAPLPPATLPMRYDFWPNPGTSREGSLSRDAVDPEARRAKPLLPPPKSPA
jgi:hypothetical protein